MAAVITATATPMGHHLTARRASAATLSGTRTTLLTR
jgi:hypothetical protein